MSFYFATTKDLGGATILEPRIPKTAMPGEDKTTPRICVSQSINGCLTSIGKNLSVGNKVYIYECKSNRVIQPKLTQVPDRCFTGEQWILKPTMMRLFMTITITWREIFEIDDEDKEYGMCEMYNIQYEICRE